jgi:uncharacterized damage-inducible protein DinB
MKFDIQKSIEILSRTPGALECLLTGLSDEWIYNNEGNDTWNVYQIIGHLIHGEKTDWIPRMKIILSPSPNKQFELFDRRAHMRENQNESLAVLLKEFRQRRDQNISELKEAEVSEKDLQRIGIHPEFGEVTLSQLLATWVTHDLTHIAQISRVMARQYKAAVGPWVSYIGILR